MPNPGFDVGKMRHFITIEAPPGKNAPPGPAGGASSVWTPLVIDLPAYVKPLSGKERENATQVVSDVSHLITIRVFGPLLPTCRIRFEGTRIFSIGAVIREDEIDNYYLIYATEIIGRKQ